jgi:cytochrome-b5 reductase
VLGALHDFATTNPDRLRLHFFVDQPDNLSAPQSRTNTDIAVKRIDSRAVKRAIGYDEPSWWSRWLRTDTKPELPQKRVLFLVCGPEPYVASLIKVMHALNPGFRMVAAIAGPYGRNFSQGNVGGILGELGFSSDQVRKL